MFGERLRVARARKRLTMAELARACDCSAQAVYKWEHDLAMPDSRRFMVLCRELDASAEWFMAAEPLDFQSTETAPQGRHAKYWVRAALDEIANEGDA